MDNTTPALLGLVLLMAASMAIGVAANKATEAGGGFLKGFFLGNRSLGSWSMALTATVMSGGTFMGFPSLIYSYGWVLALWIASYMMVPLCSFAVLGKRMGQLSRLTGAITLPDLLRERFRSPALGMGASFLIIFILAFSLIAQFKGGAIILQAVLPTIPGVTDSAGIHIADKSPAFIYGLIVFTIVVVSYTVYGGFLAAVWTDLFQSVLMAIGVLILFPLALMKSGGLAAATAAGVEQVGSGFAFAPGANREFLPVTLAASFFMMWSIAGMGQPASLVRMMAFRDTKTLRHAMFLLAIYNTLIYLPLVFTFICARAILKPLDRPDEVMPTLALTVANPWVAGLILAAPFGAVMATVSGFLVQISSAVVQDLYHRFINPHAPERTLRLLSQWSIILIGAIAAFATLHSPKFLQAIVVFAGGAAASAFLVPSVMGAFWSRATRQGAMAAMWTGMWTMLVFYGHGWYMNAFHPGYDPGIGEKGSFYPFYLFGVAPYVWGLIFSAISGVVVSLMTPPPETQDVELFFGTAEPQSASG